jgi:Zn-dependent peptidase ImmA (M78 family)
MDKDVLETVDMKALGKELQQARIRKGITQEQAAKIIGVARTTVVAIEQGNRRIRSGELIKLAQAYGLSVSDFVRPRPVLEMTEPQFRGPWLKTEEDIDLIAPYVEQLKQLARDYFELEKILQAPLVRKYAPEYSVGNLRADEAAEDIASEERIRLGLGDGPIPLLRDVLEQDVGLRIFYFPLPVKVSAIYLYDESVGGCIAINKLHREERRRISLAHEYGHFLTYRHKPEVFIEEGYYLRKPESEHLAEDFAIAFLMPASGVKRRFHDIRKAKERITAGDLSTLARYYGVSPEVMARRLEDLKLVPSGFRDQIRREGFGLRVRETQPSLGFAILPANEQQFPIRYQYLAVEAFDNGLISEGLLARFLAVDRLEARTIAEAFRENSVGDTRHE